MPLPARAPKRAHARLRSTLSVAAATALALTGLVVAAAPATASPSNPHAASPAPIAAVPTCPPDGEMPPIGNEPTFLDSGLAVFVGGDYHATGNAAESEGLLVVTGDAVFDRESGGGFDVGTAGAGSGITPAEGEPMLQVGGSLTIATPNTLRVGLLVDGGAVRVGGTATGKLDNNGKAFDTKLGAAAALAPYADFGSTISAFSKSWGTVPSNGTTTATHGVTFTGGAATGTQVFDIDAADLDGKTEFAFNDLPAGSPIVVNVHGSSVAFGMSYATIDGERVDGPTLPNFGNAASRILWNFVDATSVNLSGSGQLLGSILAPKADVEATASTNGRIYVGGDFTTKGVGNEQHNYPWIGNGPLGCTPPQPLVEVGGFDAAKTVTGEAGELVPADTVFTLSYSVVLDGVDVLTGELGLRADGTVANGPANLPAGAVVTLTETSLPAIEGVEWGIPTISPNGFEIDGGTTVEVSVTNVANPAETDEPVGGFSAKKLVTGDAAELVPDTTEFTLAYSYPAGDVTIGGTLVLLADGTVVDGPQFLPVGTVVTLSEVALPVIDGVVWGEPKLSADELVIGANTNTLVELTNTAGTAPVPPAPVPPAPLTPTTPNTPVTPETPVTPATPATPAAAETGLASTGFDGFVPALAAVVLLVIGGIALVVVRRRRAA